ncbi:hypothetical protein [Pseudonocardia sp. MH-G8]|uniref:hypothetical protein n=1 Tax=Pseudonocardia sp. MH-G8 TaxID=1854588 RepID=UPI000B9FF279|nr:hypothetical protein [Pseudonocardia sp. MH-G8]OZM83943.1 hypothetical protein CFP66_05800 [Pseudonocardia sp. MH-G8]
MRVRIATLPGSADRPNEDHAVADAGTAVVVDGLTARTETHCVHGVAWFAAQLARDVRDAGDAAPREALRAGIARTAARHSGTCDLGAPATPCAAVGVVRVGGGLLRYAVLGDVSLVLGDEHVVSDQRVAEAARAQRAAAARLPLGSDARAAALVSMKRAEIAQRNRPGGYWTAAADHAAADHALTGEVPLRDLTHVALLSDGAARAVDPFGLTGWAGVLALLASDGPDALLARVRAAERADADATRWPRTKVSDDATAVLCHDLDPREDACASP